MSDNNHVSDEYISVEDAAKALNMSTATVRRHCVSGNFPATKVGRNWVVHKSVLETFRSKKQPQTDYTFASQLNLDVALSRLMERDLENDMWAPDVLNYEDELSDVDRLKKIAADKLNGALGYDAPEIIKVPKSSLFNRSATDLSISDRLAYQGVVQEIAQYTEPLMGDRIYAARLTDKVHGTVKWLKWNEDAFEVIGSMDAETSWVITTDITSYFDFIDHVHLRKMLLDAGVPQQLVAALIEMLRTWSRSQNKGLPQGPNASRMIANFYLAEIDKQIMRDHDVQYFRYMDDIRLVSNSRSEATAALQHLSDLCYKFGLPLSSNKTASVSGLDAYRELQGDDELKMLSYEIFISDGVDAVISQELAKLFESSTSKDPIEARRARFSLYRLLVSGRDDALNVVLKKLSNIGALEVLVPKYIGIWADSDKVAQAIGRYLNDPNLNVSAYTAAWLLAIFLKDNAVIDKAVLNYARKVTIDANQERYLRCVAINVLAKFGEPSDIELIKEMTLKEYDPKIGRAAIVGLSRAGKLDRTLRENLNRRTNYAHTLSYIQGKASLPAPIKGSS